MQAPPQLPMMQTPYGVLPVPPPGYTYVPAQPAVPGAPPVALVPIAQLQQMAPVPPGMARPGAAADPGLLLSLARDDKPEELAAAVLSGVPVSSANKMGQTALHVAALWGNVESIKALVQLGADVNAPNSRGTTPLHFAAAAKRDALEVCKLLLQLGANPEQQDFFGYQAYEQANSPEVRALLGGPDQRLFDFAVEGKAEELEELITSGTVRSLKVVDEEGRHALNLAVKHKQHKVTELLLRIDPELAILPDMSANTPLHWAADTGNLELAARLIKAKTDINMQNLNMCEYSSGQWIVGEESIAPVDKSPLHLAVGRGEVEIAKLLLEAGAQPNLLDFDGASPLHLAVEAQDDELLELLLEHKANPNQPNKDMTSALHAAAQRGPARLLELLLAAGADVHAADEKGWRPHHLAARAGRLGPLQQLLAAGAALDAANGAGNTALHLAAVNGHAAAVEALLAAGADRSLVNGEGRSAADMAKSDAVRQLLAAS